MQSIKDILFELLLEQLAAAQWEKNKTAKKPAKRDPETLGERKSA